MKTEAQIKDIIRNFNGKIIEYKNNALDNLYKGKDKETIEYINAINNLRSKIYLLEYILDDSCVLGEDY